MTELQIKTLAIMHYADKILELVDNQLRNDNETLTRSDLQGAIQAIVINIFNEKR